MLRSHWWVSSTDWYDIYCGGDWTYHLSRHGLFGLTTLWPIWESGVRCFKILLNLVIPDKIDFVTDGLSYPLWKKFPLFFSSFVSQEREGENPPGISQDRFSTIEIIQQKSNIRFFTWRLLPVSWGLTCYVLFCVWDEIVRWLIILFSLP